MVCWQEECAVGAVWWRRRDARCTRGTAQSPLAQRLISSATKHQQVLRPDREADIASAARPEDELQWRSCRRDCGAPDAPHSSARSPPATSPHSPPPPRPPSQPSPPLARWQVSHLYTTPTCSLRWRGGGGIATAAISIATLVIASAVVALTCVAIATLALRPTLVARAQCYCL